MLETEKEMVNVEDERSRREGEGESEILDMT